MGSANVSGSITATAGDGSTISLTGTTAGGNVSVNGGSNSLITATGGNVTGNFTYTRSRGPGYEPFHLQRFGRWKPHRHERERRRWRP